jgi:hypothetical protein
MSVDMTNIQNNYIFNPWVDKYLLSHLINFKFSFAVFYIWQIFPPKIWLTCILCFFLNAFVSESPLTAFLERSIEF